MDAMTLLLPTALQSLAIPMVLTGVPSNGIGEALLVVRPQDFRATLALVGVLVSFGHGASVTIGDARSLGTPAFQTRAK